jgi:thioredoxin 2
MDKAQHVVCPHCDQVNRIPAGKPQQKAACGRCGGRLFEGRPVELDSARLEKHAERNDIPVIVDFWAPWCGPCRAMGPVFEKAARDLEPLARFVKVNVDENPDAASRYGVRGIPALFAIANGQVAAQHAGVADAKLFASWVARLSSRGT